MLAFIRKTIDAILIVFAFLFALWAVANLFLPHPQGSKWLAQELTYVVTVAACALVFRKARSTFGNNPAPAKPYRLSKPQFAFVALALAGAWGLSYFAQRTTHPSGLWTGIDTYYAILFGGALSYLAFTTFRKPKQR